MRPTRGRASTGCLMILALLLSCGCGGPRASGTVTGTVTYDGKPVNDATITFTPVDGVGTTAAGTISDGKYSVTGVTVGKKKVLIVGEEKTNPTFGGRDMENAEKMQQRQRERVKVARKPTRPAELVPANAIGNNQDVEVIKGLQTMDFALLKPKK